MFILLSQVPIREQAKRLANKLARDNVTGSSKNDTGVIIAPQGYIQDVYATPYDWFPLTLERNNKNQKSEGLVSMPIRRPNVDPLFRFELFVSNSGHVLLNTDPNVAGDVRSLCMLK